MALLQTGSGWMRAAIVDVSVTAAGWRRLLFIKLPFISVVATLSAARNRLR